MNPDILTHKPRTAAKEQTSTEPRTEFSDKYFEEELSEEEEFEPLRRRSCSPFVLTNALLLQMPRCSTNSLQ